MTRTRAAPSEHPSLLATSWYGRSSAIRSATAAATRGDIEARASRTAGPEVRQVGELLDPLERELIHRHGFHSQAAPSPVTRPATAQRAAQLVPRDPEQPGPGPHAGLPEPAAR